MCISMCMCWCMLYTCKCSRDDFSLNLLTFCSLLRARERVSNTEQVSLCMAVSVTSLSSHRAQRPNAMVGWSKWTASHVLVHILMY